MNAHEDIRPNSMSTINTFLNRGVITRASAHHICGHARISGELVFQSVCNGPVDVRLGHTVGVRSPIISPMASVDSDNEVVLARG